MSINNSNGVMQIWEEAYFCLSHGSDDIEEFVSLKKYYYEHDWKEAKELQSRVLDLSRSEIEGKRRTLFWEKERRERSQFKNQLWFANLALKPIFSELAILDEELSKRPVDCKKSRKEKRQERAKLNRSYGRCKNK